MSLSESQRKTCAIGLRKNPLLPVLLLEKKLELVEQIVETKPDEQEQREAHYLLIRAIDEVGEYIDAECDKLCRGADTRN